jgi:GxxExxY protein
MEIDQITGLIVKAAFQLHTDLGPGMLESVYEAVLGRMLEVRGLNVERQKRIPINFQGMQFEEGFRADMLVESRVLVELKSVEALAPVHKKQVLTYLRLMNLRVALLINFGAPRMKDGLRRVVNNHVPSPGSVLHVNRRADAGPEAHIRLSATSAAPATSA